MIIQHNIPAMNAYRNLNNNQNAIAGNLEKLSSGYQINRAGDNAAGLAISEKMRSQITGLDAAQKNVADGISLVKTAEGALQEVHDMLNRMTELATLSANGTFDNEVDRAALQDEVVQLQEEINRIADSTNFNGMDLLNGALDSKDTVTVLTEGTYSNIDLSGLDSTSGITMSWVDEGTYNTSVFDSADDLSQVFSGSTDFTDMDDLFIGYTNADGSVSYAQISLSELEFTSAGDLKTTGSSDVATAVYEADKADYVAGIMAGLEKDAESGIVILDSTKYADLMSDMADLAGMTVGAGDVTQAVKDAAYDKLLSDYGIKDDSIVMSQDNYDDVKELLEETAESVFDTANGAYGTTITGKFVDIGKLTGGLTGATELTAAIAANTTAADLGASGTATLNFNAEGYKGTQASVESIGMKADSLDADVQAIWNALAANASDAISLNATGTDLVDGGGTAGGAVSATFQAMSTVQQRALMDSVKDAYQANQDEIMNAVNDALENANITVDRDVATGVVTMTSNQVGVVPGQIILDADGSGDISETDTAFKFSPETKSLTDGNILKIPSDPAEIKNNDQVVINGKTYIFTTQTPEELKSEEVHEDKEYISIYTDDSDGSLADGAGLKLRTQASIATELANLIQADHTAGRNDKNSEWYGIPLADKYDLGNGEVFIPSVGDEVEITDNSDNGLQLQIGDTSDSFNQLMVGVEDMHVNNLGTHDDYGNLVEGMTIADVSVADQDSATAAIDVIKDAINQVSTNRAGLGAIQNRLEHTANNLSVMEENIQDAESTIRDTDVAAEMMEYTKNNILIQSSQSMLAQANQLPQGVLQLLG